MQQATQPPTIGAARLHLLSILRKLDEEILTHLKTIARRGEIQGNDPRADLYAHIVSKAMSTDLNDLDEEAARQTTRSFSVIANLRIVTDDGRDPVEEFFHAVPLGATPTESEEVKLLVDCVELVLDEIEDYRSTGV